MCVVRTCGLRSYVCLGMQYGFYLFVCFYMSFVILIISEHYFHLLRLKTTKIIEKQRIINHISRFLHIYRTPILFTGRYLPVFTTGNYRYRYLPPNPVYM